MKITSFFRWGSTREPVLSGVEMELEISWVLAFGAGVLSFFSPCVLPLLPAYLSFITGATVDEILENRPARREVLFPVLFFCCGFSLVFILMGATASTLGQAVLRYQRILHWIGGGLVILFGLHLLGAFRLRLLHLDKRLHLSARPTHALGALVVGIAFAAGWTPCIGPILGSILTYASTRETLSQGILLLAFYSAGFALPFVAVGFALGNLLPLFRGAGRWMRPVSVASGALLIFMGILLITDNLNLLYRWAL